MLVVQGIIADRGPSGSDLVQDLPMPSLLRFLTIVAIIGGLVYGAVFALANFVTPTPREMTVFVPPDKFLKR